MRRVSHCAHKQDVKKFDARAELPRTRGASAVCSASVYVVECRPLGVCVRVPNLRGLRVRGRSTAVRIC
jgi:hypothetical protein